MWRQGKIFTISSSLLYSPPKIYTARQKGARKKQTLDFVKNKGERFLLRALYHGSVYPVFCSTQRWGRRKQRDSLVEKKSMYLKLQKAHIKISKFFRLFYFSFVGFSRTTSRLNLSTPQQIDDKFHPPPSK